jgi:hypothetical protein
MYWPGCDRHFWITGPGTSEEARTAFSEVWHEDSRTPLQELRQRELTAIEAAIGMGIVEDDSRHLSVPMFGMRSAVLGERVAIFEARFCQMPKVSWNGPDNLAGKTLSRDVSSKSDADFRGTPLSMQTLPI